MHFLHGDLYSALLFSDPSMLLHVLIVSLFLLLSCISLYEHTTCWFIHTPVGERLSYSQVLVEQIRLFINMHE